MTFSNLYQCLDGINAIRFFLIFSNFFKSSILCLTPEHNHINAGTIAFDIMRLKSLFKVINIISVYFKKFMKRTQTEPRQNVFRFSSFFRDILVPKL